MEPQTLRSTVTGIRSKDPYHVLADAIPQIVWTARPDGYNDYFNKRWFEYTGFTEEQTYHGDEDVIHEDDFERYTQTWNEALRSGNDYEIEYRFRRASDGMYRWHLGRGIAVRDERGTIVKWLGTCTDIHDQKAAAEKIQQLNQELEVKVQERTAELNAEIERRQVMEERDKANLQRLKKVLESMILGAIMLDENQKVLHVNDRFCGMFGLKLKPEEIIGMHGENILAQIAELKEKHAVATLRRQLAAKEPIPYYEVHMKDGQIFAREYLPIFVEGTYRGDLLLYRDITQEKRVDAVKSEFMALASHQLRTPLTAVRWIFSKLRRTAASHLSLSEQALLDEGRRASTRMAETIDTMLTISQIEAGSISMNTKEVLVTDLLTDVIATSSLAPDLTMHAVSIECPQDLRFVTDPNYLKEILRNLIGNSVKYTPTGGSITVRVEQEGKQLTFFIEDTGVGIPQDQQAKIFSKFFRGSNVVTTSTQGTGLGLYLVYLLVSLLNGTVGFTSKEGIGTTFTVCLPKG